MRTKHQYLDKYPILRESKKLIVGTIHPHDHENFHLPFFYGNMLSIWTILSDAFPDELTQPLTLDKILTFLKSKDISVSDTITICDRTTPTALDEDLVPVELNKRLKEDIKNSEIVEILFTSGFGKNNAFKLFYEDILRLTVTKNIKENREIILDKEIFGRPMKLIVLYSPSGASNVGISKSKLFLMNKEKYNNSKRPVYDFKVDYYRKMFS